MIQRSFPMFVSCQEDHVSAVHNQIQKEVDKFYAITVKTGRKGVE